MAEQLTRGTGQLCHTYSEGSFFLMQAVDDHAWCPVSLFKVDPSEPLTLTQLEILDTWEAALKALEWYASRETTND